MQFEILGYKFVPTYEKGVKGKYQLVVSDKSWKKPERKRKNLIRLGADQYHAYVWSRTRKGGWAIAQSPILGTTVTVKCLQQRGYESMLDYYTNVAPQLNEPLYTRPVRTVV